MGLADALHREKDEGIRKGPICSVCLLLLTLGESDRAALTAALDDPTLAHTQISRALKAEGYSVLPVTIGRHRKMDCQRR